MAEAFKCDRCGTFYDPYANPKLYIGKMDQFYSFKRYDLCCTCQALLEIWWSDTGHNNVDVKEETNEDIVVDPDKKCCYNCKYAEIDIYKNSRCTNKESVSYNIHMLAERFYCNSFEQKEENKDDN